MQTVGFETPSKQSPQQIATRVLSVIAILIAFLVSLELMGSGFKLLGKDTASQIISATSNPFISLFIGLLATAIIQSSSTTTTMVVSIVASGALTMENAVPMIMGANIGTSVTSTLVSLGHITKRKEFRKAIAAATVHDFFNIIVVLFIFPIEYFTGGLSYLAKNLASVFYSGPSETSSGLMDVTIKPVAKSIIHLVNDNPYIVIGAAMVMLFFTLRGFTTVLQKLLIGSSQKKLENMVFSSPVKSLSWGVLITAAVQSSSVTSSLTVPLVATNKISLNKAFPFLMGANIGTTVTAMIAAATQTEAALSIAFAHLMFNLFGVLLLFPIPAIRIIPIWCAKKLGAATLKNRMVGFAYVIVTFFLLPFLLIYMTSGNSPLAKKAQGNNANAIESVK